MKIRGGRELLITRIGKEMNMADFNFKESAEEIVRLVGGKENVNGVTHCVTRVRFRLEDQSIASQNKEEVKNVPGVIQVVEAGGQFQVVIGPKVTKVYDEVVAITGHGEAADDASSVKPDESSEKKEEKKGNPVMRLASGIILPCMPALVGCGLVSALFTILQVAGLVTNDEGIGMILYGVGQTCMYFMPIIIGGSAAQFFGVSPYLGNAVGGALMYSSFIEAAAAETTTKLFGLIPVTFSNYSGTLLPAIVSVWVASVLYKFFKKVIPDIVSYAFAPLCTLAIALPLAFAVVGPVMTIVSNLLSTAVLGIYNLSPIVCGVILGGSWLLFIVPLGLHMAFITVFINNLFTIGYEPVMGLLAGIMTLSGALFAVGIRSKSPNTKQVAFSTGVTNILGVSEPGLYGIILQHKATMITCFIGGAASGVVAALCHTYVFTINGVGGIFALPQYVDPSGSMMSVIGYVISNAVGFIISFLLTMIWKFDPDESAA